MYPGAFVTTTPDKPAAVLASTGQAVSYAELEARSCQIAHYFRSLGLGRGDHIALVSTNDLRVFDVYWAAMRTGLLITAVNHHLTPSEVAYIVDDCEAELVVFSAALAHLAEDFTLIENTPRVRYRVAFGGAIAGHTSLDKAVVGLPQTAPDDQPRGADMLYSSGTTGRPKGIVPTLPDRQVFEPGDTMVTLASQEWSVTSDSIYLSPAPLYHAAPLRTCAAVQALGGTVVVMDKFDAEGSLKAIEDFRVTHSQWVPTMFVRLLKLPESIRQTFDVSSMEVAIHAAAPCPVDVKRQMIDWWGPILLEYYSSTELNGMTIVSSAEWLDKPGTVGRDGLIGTVHICADDGAELPAGQHGLIYFERDALPFHYHRDPEKTRAAQHPEHPTWTTTGDMGYLDQDRYLYLTDRKSFLIISGGVNLYPQEIENCLTMHPAIFDVAVIGEPDHEMGETVLAVVQLATGGTDSTNDVEKSIRDYATQNLAKFKHPRRYVFVDQLPRTATGKLAKHKFSGIDLQSTVAANL